MNMRKVLFTGIIAASMALFASCNQPTNEEAVVVEEVATEAVASKVNIKVDGMMCSHGCVNTIEKALGSTNGVSYASVNFDESVATVEFDSEELSEEEIVEVINGLHDGIYTATLASMESSDAGSKKSSCSQPCDPSKCTDGKKAAHMEKGKKDCATACTKMTEA